jgi:RNA-binding protein YlmH
LFCPFQIGLSFLHYSILTNKEECLTSFHIIEICSNQQDKIRNIKRFRVDMSEVDFTNVVLSSTNWSKPTFIIQNLQIWKIVNLNCSV